MKCGHYIEILKYLRTMLQVQPIRFTNVMYEIEYTIYLQCLNATSTIFTKSIHLVIHKIIYSMVFKMQSINLTNITLLGNTKNSSP